MGEFFEKVQINGSDYIIVSNQDGYFQVENLPYGEYFLWEVQPPYGYSSISDGVSFIIDEDSYSKIITIEDKEIPIIPKPNNDIPHKKTRIMVPKTGDITLLLMIGAGIILSSLGYSMVRERNRQTNV